MVRLPGLLVILMRASEEVRERETETTEETETETVLILHGDGTVTETTRPIRHDAYAGVETR